MLAGIHPQHHCSDKAPKESLLAGQASSGREKSFSTSAWNRSSVLLNCPQFLNSPHELGGLNQAQHSWCGVTSTEQEGIVTPLHLMMTVLFLAQPSVWFASFATKKCFWLVCVLAPSVTSGPFQQSCQFVPGLYQCVGSVLKIFALSVAELQGFLDNLIFNFNKVSLK